MESEDSEVSRNSEGIITCDIPEPDTEIPKQSTSLKSIPVEPEAVFSLTPKIVETGSGFVFGRARCLADELQCKSSDSAPPIQLQTQDTNDENARDASIYTTDGKSEATVELVRKYSTEVVNCSTNEVSNDCLKQIDDPKPSTSYSKFREDGSPDSFYEECDLLYNTLWPNNECGEEGLQDLGSNLCLNFESNSTDNWLRDEADDLSINASNEHRKPCSDNNDCDGKNINASLSSYTMTADISELHSEKLLKSDSSGVSSEGEYFIIQEKCASNSEGFDITTLNTADCPSNLSTDTENETSRNAYSDSVSHSSDECGNTNEDNKQMCTRLLGTPSEKSESRLTPVQPVDEHISHSGSEICQPYVHIKLMKLADLRAYGANVNVRPALKCSNEYSGDCFSTPSPQSSSDSIDRSSDEGIKSNSEETRMRIFNEKLISLSQDIGPSDISIERTVSFQTTCTTEEGDIDKLCSLPQAEILDNSKSTSVIDGLHELAESSVGFLQNSEEVERNGNVTTHHNTPKVDSEKNHITTEGCNDRDDESTKAITTYLTKENLDCAIVASQCHSDKFHQACSETNTADLIKSMKNVYLSCGEETANGSKRDNRNESTKPRALSSLNTLCVPKITNIVQPSLVTSSMHAVKLPGNLELQSGTLLSPIGHTLQNFDRKTTENLNQAENQVETPSASVCMTSTSHKAINPNVLCITFPNSVTTTASSTFLGSDLRTPDGYVTPQSLNPKETEHYVSFSPLSSNSENTNKTSTSEDYVKNIPISSDTVQMDWLVNSTTNISETIDVRLSTSKKTVDQELKNIDSSGERVVLSSPCSSLIPFTGKTFSPSSTFGENANKKLNSLQVALVTSNPFSILKCPNSLEYTSSFSETRKVLSDQESRVLPNSLKSATPTHSTITSELRQTSGETFSSASIPRHCTRNKSIIPNETGVNSFNRASVVIADVFSDPAAKQIDKGREGLKEPDKKEKAVGNHSKNEPRQSKREIFSYASTSHQYNFRHRKHATVGRLQSSLESERSSVKRKRERSITTLGEQSTYMTRSKMRKMMDATAVKVLKNGKKILRQQVSQK